MISPYCYFGETVKRQLNIWRSKRCTNMCTNIHTSISVSNVLSIFTYADTFTRCVLIIKSIWRWFAVSYRVASHLIGITTYFRLHFVLFFYFLTLADWKVTATQTNLVHKMDNWFSSVTWIFKFSFTIHQYIYKLYNFCSLLFQKNITNKHSYFS